MKIPIVKLTSGYHELEYKELPSVYGFENDKIFNKPVFSVVKVDKSVTHIYLQVESKTVGSFDCDRCLQDFGKELTGELKLYFEVTGSGGHFDPDIIEEEKNVNFRSYKANEANIDLSDDIRDVLLLALPMKNLCSKNCKGFCPGCGNNLNQFECVCEKITIDPRWDALKKLQL
ncbi:DUF177 domain-containing protein [candidate division KSB1 bacterium]|nr:DUF177 domain-containing protein [candidate division KSB1 bacterium]